MSGVSIYDVDVAKNLKTLVLNPEVEVSDALRVTIMNLDDNDLVRICKSISSLKILSVDIITSDMLARVLNVVSPE